MPVTIHIAGTELAGAIASLSRSTFYDTFAKDNRKEDMDKFMNEVFTYDALVAEVGAPHNIFLVAKEDDELAGYARLREFNQPPELGEVQSLEIARLYAAPHQIGRGIGSLLMQQSLAIAKELGKSIAWLGVWERNARAIAFYHRWGFEKFAEHIFQLGDDAQTDYLMKRPID